MATLQVVAFALAAIALLLFRYVPVFLAKKSKAPIELDEKRQSRIQVKNAERVKRYKTLYYKVQNLEEFPEVLPEAKDMLLELLQQGFLMAQYNPQTRSILDMKEFDRVALDKFLEAERQEVSEGFEAYVARRAAGSPRELFNTKEDAVQWLKHLAPLNFIDGAWLCRVHKITTPFALRRVTKNAWQVFSEELGDGDLEKNHVLIYRDLLRKHGVHLPDSDSIDFIHDRHEMGNEQVWRSSIGQLLISLFPNEFLPEILGLNLHFEALAPTGLKATKEFPEVGISAYYFALHISIDNADSGHSGMALANIIGFMDLIRETGLMDPQEAWKRIQAGYLLSQSLDETDTVDTYEEKLVQILHKKANLARKIHCTSRARIGGQSLSAWFSSPFADDGGEKVTGDDSWKYEFLNALADSKPWVVRGNSDKSLLMRELSWTGRMFGAFTDSEVDLLRTWINSLGPKGVSATDAYWTTVGGHTLLEKSFPDQRQDVATTHPFFSPEKAWNPAASREFIPRAPLHVPHLKLDALLPLWFAHACLLENMVSSPYQTATTFTSKILRILRVEMGYSPDNTGIAGMDEQTNPGRRPDLIALGCEIARRHNLPEPACLGDIIGAPKQDASDVTKVAHSLLEWSMRPNKNGMFLLGLSRAFLDLEVLVAADESLLSRKDREYLQDVIRRKTAIMEECLEELKTMPASKSHEFVGGYELGREQLENILA